MTLCGLLAKAKEGLSAVALSPHACSSQIKAKAGLSAEVLSTIDRTKEEIQDFISGLDCWPFYMSHVKT